MTSSRPALILMCGLSFSGKTTIARALADGLNATVVSFDAINEERGLYGGQGIPLEEWRFTKELAHDRVENFLREGISVVVDDTSSPRFLRDEWRKIADTTGARFELVYVWADPEVIHERVQANRLEPTRPDVVDAVLTEHIDQFESPAAGEAHRTVLSTNSNDDAEIAALISLLNAPQ